MTWFRDTSEDRKWVRQEIDDIKWHRKVGTRFFTNGEDDTDSFLSDKLHRAKHALGFSRKREDR